MVCLLEPNFTSGPPTKKAERKMTMKVLVMVLAIFAVMVAAYGQDNSVVDVSSILNLRGINEQTPIPQQIETIKQVVEEKLQERLSAVRQRNYSRANRLGAEVKALKGRLDQLSTRVWRLEYRADQTDGSIRHLKGQVSGIKSDYLRKDTAERTYVKQSDYDLDKANLLNVANGNKGVTPSPTANPSPNYTPAPNYQTPPPTAQQSAIPNPPNPPQGGTMQQNPGGSDMTPGLFFGWSAATIGVLALIAAIVVGSIVIIIVCRRFKCEKKLDAMKDILNACGAGSVVHFDHGDIHGKLVK